MSTSRPGATAVVTAMAPERRHTWHFLREIRQISPVHLDTEVDMSEILTRRAAGTHHSTVTHVLCAAARVLADHPEANAAIRGRWFPRVARYSGVNGKFTLDRTLGGRRIVLSAVLPDLERAGLDEVQREVERLRDADPAVEPDFAGARLLQRLPVPVGVVLFRLGVRPLAGRGRRLGTFAVTSLGHRAVDGFYSVGGTTITLGVGRITPRPVVREGAVVVVAPVMRLSLTFDHRVLDGAEAADVLTEIKETLESVRHADSGGAGPRVRVVAP